MENKAELKKYLAHRALQTRSYGSCYIHAGKRDNATAQGTLIDGIFFHVSGFGRSLQSGGHRYKVHANYEATGKPVPSRELNQVFVIKKL